MPRFQSSAFRSGRMNLLLCPVLCCLLSKSTFCTLNPLCVTERYYATISLIYVNVCLKTFKFLEKPGWKSNKIVITNIYLMTPCAATPRLLGATSPLWMISTLHWTVIFTFFFFFTKQTKQVLLCPNRTVVLFKHLKACCWFITKRLVNSKANWYKILLRYSLSAK